MTSFSPITRGIRSAQRVVQVIEVLGRYGFADFVERSGIDRLIERGREALGRPRPEHEKLTTPERVRRMLEELGPTFIKLGQILSTRPDLIPEDWAEEFKHLQNAVPGVDYELIHKTIQEELPGCDEKLFESIEREPLAAASMAQVHRAVLLDGTKIVLKVLRPGIRDVISTDMEILRTFAEITESRFNNLGYSPIKVVREFAKELGKEVDLMHEGRSTERLCTFFEDDPDIVFPKVHWQATTQSVLALDEIKGTVLSHLGDSKITAKDRRKLVANGARAVFRQCLELGFFHADPHPGNLIALPHGRIAFIDCGMTGEIDAQTSRQLADLVSGVVSQDMDRVMRAVGELGDIGPEKISDRDLRSDVHGIISQFNQTSLAQLNLGKFLQDLFRTLRLHRVQCPADLIFLIKALTTIESVGRMIDPGFEMVEFARPYIENLVERRYSPSAIRTRVQQSLLKYIELIEELPGEIRPFLTQLLRNKLSLHIQHRGLDRLTSTIEHASRNIAFALITASLVVGSSILVLAARGDGMNALRVLGLLGYIAAGIMMIGMLISDRRARKK